MTLHHMQATRPVLAASFDPGDVIHPLSSYPDDAEPWLGWTENLHQEARARLRKGFKIAGTYDGEEDSGDMPELVCEDEGAEEGF